jgi:hypothetical protein
MTAFDPAAELLDALVEMKRDADALFGELARNRDADAARLMEMAREGADALKEMMRNHPQGTWTSPVEPAPQTSVS